MKNKTYPILGCCALILTMLACNIGSTVPPPAGQSGNILTLAVQTLQAQTPTANSGISVDAALTLAVETLQAQVTPTNTDVPQNPPTSKPKKTKEPKPSSTPQPSNTSVPPTSGTLHVKFPIGHITLVAPIQIIPVNPKLDYQGAANYGEANLSNGFSPDPYSVGMTTGGNVDVSYLGGSCSGFATTKPDLRINFGGGRQPPPAHIFCRLEWRS